MTACAIFSCHIGRVAQVATRLIRRILSTAIRTTQAGCSTCTCIYPTITTTTIGWVRLLPLLPVRFTNGDHYKELSLHKHLLQRQQYDVGAWGVYAMKWTESSVFIALFDNLPSLATPLLQEMTAAVICDHSDFSCVADSRKIYRSHLSESSLSSKTVPRWTLSHFSFTSRYSVVFRVRRRINRSATY